MSIKPFIQITLQCLLVCLLFPSCDFKQTKIIDRYYAVAIDHPKNLQLAYKVESGDYVGIVEPYLSRVGITSDYLIVMQSSPYIDVVDSTQYRYFIVPIKKTYTLWPEAGVIGPMGRDSFLVQSSALGIGHVVWRSFN